MNKEEKDRLIRYGKLVMDFVNGKDSDEILTKYITNLHAAFDLSDNFIQQISKYFLTLKELSMQYSSDELLLMRLVHDQEAMMWKLFRECDEYIYDREQKSFTCHFYQYPEDDNTEDENFEITLDEVIECKREKTYYGDAYGYDEKLPIDEFLDYELKIEEIKPKSRDRFRELVNICHRIVYLEKCHERIKYLQDNMKSFLVEFVSAENVFMLSGLNSIVETYNNSKANFIIVTSDGLKEINKFNYDYFLHQEIKIEKLFNETWCYCFIEILKHPEYSGRDRIKRCQDCRNFYIQSKLFEKQIYCSVCSRKSHVLPELSRERVKITRKAKANLKLKHREKEMFTAQYTRLIKAGYSKSEAKQRAQEYVIEQRHEIE